VCSGREGGADMAKLPLMAGWRLRQYVLILFFWSQAPKTAPASVAANVKPAGCCG
jgi:hypothetical protein